MATVYLDLDGTLLDVSDRYWALHSDLVRRHGLNAVPPDEFWGMKRRRAPLPELLGGSDALRRAYWADWLRLIESSDYLAKDRLLPQAGHMLARLSDGHRLVLVTMRKHRSSLLAQMARFGIEDLFAKVLCAGQDKQSKAALIEEDLRAPADALVVGDTEVDIEAGRALGISTAAVLTGLRDRERLAAVRPTFLLGSVLDLPDVLERLLQGDDARLNTARVSRLNP